MTAVFYAIQEGHAHLINLLISSRDGAAMQRYDALSYATLLEKLEMMQLMIDAKAPLERPNITETYSWNKHEDSSPLARAIGNNNLVAMQLLLDAKAKIVVPGTNYTYHLMRHAIQTSSTRDTGDAMRLLLDSNASPMVKSQEKTLLRDAVEKNRPAIAKMLIELNASPDVIYGKKNQDTPLSIATRCRYTEMVKVLIDGKANVNLRPKEKPTPLACAAENEHVEVVRLLLEGKASLDNVDDRGWNAIRYAIPFHGDCDPAQISIIKMLVEAKAPLESVGRLENTMNFISPRTNLARVLVDCKANVDVICEGGQTLLMKAIRLSSIEMIETVLSGDPASFDAQDEDGMTALMLTVFYYGSRDADAERSRVLRMLLEYAWAHCAAEHSDEPVAKRFKRME